MMPRMERSLRVLARGVVPGLLLGAGGEQDELGEVPVEDRHLGDLLGVQHGRHVGAVGLEELAFGGVDGHSLGELADVEPEIDLGLGVDVDPDGGDDR